MVLDDVDGRLGVVVELEEGQEAVLVAERASRSRAVLQEEAEDVGLVVAAAGEL